jgi:hypothetical protein
MAKIISTKTASPLEIDEDKKKESWYVFFQLRTEGASSPAAPPSIPCLSQGSNNGPWHRTPHQVTMYLFGGQWAVKYVSVGHCGQDNAGDGVEPGCGRA